MSWSGRSSSSWISWIDDRRNSAEFGAKPKRIFVPTYLSQRDLPSYDDPLPESEEVLLGGSQGGHVREIAAGHPTANQSGPLPITHEEPRRGGQGSGSPPHEKPAGQVEAASTRRPRPAYRPVEAEERLLLNPRRHLGLIAIGLVHTGVRAATVIATNSI
jgi:hypothetical protein